MQRLDRNQLIDRIFPMMLEVATRYDDLDVQGHVNNVAVAVVFQEARARFNVDRLADLLAAGGSAVVGSLLIDFAGQMYAPAPITVRTGVLEIGTKSFVIGQIASQNGKDTAFAQAQMVATHKDGAATLPDSVRAALERSLIR